MLFAYFGPETALPLTSVLAATTGLLMMVGRASVRRVARIARSIRRETASKVRG